MQREERARVRKKLITELKFLEGSGKGDGNQKTIHRRGGESLQNN